MKTKLFIIVLIVCSAMLSCRPKPIPGPEGDDGNGEDYIYGPGNITGIYDPDRRVDIIMLKSEGEEIEFNEWNWSEGRLQLISSEHYFEEYYYGEDGRIEKKDGSRIDGHFEYVYVDDYLSEVRWYTYANDVCYRSYKLKYEDGKLARVVQSKAYSENEVGMYYDIEWVGENVSEIEVKDDSTKYVTYKLEYDDKINPFYNYMGLPLTDRLMLYANVSALSRNNVTKLEVKYEYESDEYVDMIVTNTYLYDEENYPVLVEMERVGDDEFNCTFEIKYLIDVENDGGVINGYEYVDLGLPSGLKWAKCNIGAESPELYGNYYAWGETTPPANGYYNVENCSTMGVDLDDISGNPLYDAATANMGGTWRMPNNEEFRELIDVCRWDWTLYNDKIVYKVRGPSGNHILLPLCGQYDSSLSFEDEFGWYWSSTPYKDELNDKACMLSICIDIPIHGHGLIDSLGEHSPTREYGRTIRAVSN